MLPKFNVTTYHIPFVFSVLRILRKLRKLQVLIYSSYWTTKHVKKGKHIEISIRKKEKPRRCLGRQGPRHRRREHRRRQGEKRQFLRVHEAERTSSRICRRLILLAVMGIPRRYVSTIRWAFDSPSQRERERDWFWVLVLQNTERSKYFWLFDRKVIVQSIRGNIPTLHKCIYGECIYRRVWLVQVLLWGG